MIKSFVRKFSSVNSISLLDLSAADISLGGGKKIKKQVDLANALRMNGVLKTDRIIRSFERVDRALFLPSSTATTGVNIALGKEKDNKHGSEASQYFEPYENKPVPLIPYDKTSDATMSTPYHHALILELLESKLYPGARVLDIGCGSGYLVAVVADLVINNANVSCTKGSVVGIERAKEIIKVCESSLIACPITHSLVEQNQIKIKLRYSEETELNGQEGKSKDVLLAMKEKFDVVNVGYSIQEDDREELERLLSVLTPNGGRLLCPLVVDRANNTQFYHYFDKNGNQITKTQIDKSKSGPVLVSKKHDGLFKYVDLVEKRKKEEADLEGKLNAWKENFKKKFNKNPTKDEMLNDAEAGVWFKEFVKLRQRKWVK